MPQAVIPLIGIAIGATMTGLQMAGVGQPDTGAMAAKQLNDAKMAQAKADAEAKHKAILASMSRAQEQGGGALTEPGLTSLASVIAGMPGEATTTAGQGALSSYLGTPTATASGGGGGGVGGGDNFLQAFQQILGVPSQSGGGGLSGSQDSSQLVA